MSLDERREQQLIALIGRTAELEENVDQDVTSGSSPSLDGTNFTSIPNVDQDVTSGASPTFDGSNITSVPAADLDNSGISRIRVTKNDAQSIPNNTWTIVEYDDEDFDNLNEYDNTTNYRFTAASAGYYLITASLLSASVAWSAGNVFQISLYHSGSRVIDGFRTVADASVTTYKHSTMYTIRYLAANDYLDIRANQGSGGAINTHTEASYNYFSVHKLS